MSWPGEQKLNYPDTLRKTILAAVVGTLILFPFEMAFAIDLGVVGKTYPIAERDASDELKERVKSVNWQKMLEKNGIERMKKYKPDTIKSLPRATEDRIRMVSMNYTLEFDITDGKGNVIYPKGYTFNPLDFMTYTRIIVVINGADRDQVEWFKKSPYYKKSNVMTLITDGNYYDLSGELGQPVYFAHEKIASRLQLSHVPSIAVQRKRMMEVSEIDVDHQDKNSHNN
jgi:conjugal transfer pilus assembly protein TraW